MSINIGEKGAVAIAIALVAIVAMVLYTFVYSIQGKKITDSIIKKEKKEVSTNITITADNIIITKEEAIRNLTLVNKQNQAKILNNLFLELNKKKKDIEEYKRNKDTFFIDKINRIDFKVDKMGEQLERLNKIQVMSNNSENVIEVSVNNVDKYDLVYKKMNIKRKFFLAKLQELQNKLNDSILEDINKNETKEIYAQILMIKSISYYLEYKPSMAFETYTQAKQAYPSLRVIQELEKEYKDISPNDVKEIKYAYTLVASIEKTKDNLDKSADQILSPSQSYQLRKLGYNLYLSINKVAIRVYTIIEYKSKLELEKKLLEIRKIEKTSDIYSTTNHIPEEYTLTETRKKIYVFNSSERKSDIRLVKKLIKKNFKYIEAKGRWNIDFGLYAIYYDGNAYDKNDLDRLLNQVRNIVGSHSIKTFAYQQSKGKTIKYLFKDKNLKYVIILEKNAYIR